MPFSSILVFNLEPQTNIKTTATGGGGGIRTRVFALWAQQGTAPLLRYIYKAQKEIINKFKSILFFYYTVFAVRAFFILHIYYNIIFLKNQKVFPKSQRFCFFSLRHKS